MFSALWIEVSKLIVDLNTIIGDEHGKIDLDFTVTLENMDHDKDIFRSITPISVVGSIYKVMEEMFLTCTLSAKLEVCCGRCLRPFNYPLRISVDAELIRHDNFVEDDDLDDIIVYEDNILDFNEIIREQIITSLPMKVLCDENCKGLCEFCGSDLNLKECKCNIDYDSNIDPRLIKLKELLRQD